MSRTKRGKPPRVSVVCVCEGWVGGRREGGGASPMSEAKPGKLPRVSVHHRRREEAWGGGRNGNLQGTRPGNQPK